MLKQRILTASILIPLVIFIVFFVPQPYFALITAVIVGLSAWEWAKLSGWQITWQRTCYSALVFCFLPFAMLLPITSITVGAILWLGLFYCVMRMRKQIKERVYPRWLIGLLGCLILLPFWEGLQLLSRYRALLFYFLLLIWVADTAAYFGGKLFGRFKLAPAISPNKTIEGFASALVCTFVFAIAMGWFWFTPKQLEWNWLLPTISSVVAAVIGDLFESLLKRQQGLKDSGHWLPGHGGILDRIDALLAATPIFVVGALGLDLLT